MPDHPLKSLVTTTMESIQQMVDVNTVVGEAIETPQGTIIIPVSRVSLGFAVGGSDWESSEDKSRGSGNQGKGESPFGGGSGAGVTVQPVGFLVVTEREVNLLFVEEDNPYVKLLGMVPDLIEDFTASADEGQQSTRESSGFRSPRKSHRPMGIKLR